MQRQGSSFPATFIQLDAVNIKYIVIRTKTRYWTITKNDLHVNGVFPNAKLLSSPKVTGRRASSIRRFQEEA